MKTHSIDSGRIKEADTERRGHIVRQAAGLSWSFVTRRKQNNRPLPMATTSQRLVGHIFFTVVFFSISTLAFAQVPYKSIANADAESLLEIANELL